MLIESNTHLRRSISIILALVGLTALLAGCVYPEHYSDWQWRQYNPNYQPLPGDPSR